MLTDKIELSFIALVLFFHINIIAEIRLWRSRMVPWAGIGHDKIPSDFFATPPQSVTFVIRFPALRTAVGQSSPTTLRLTVFNRPKNTKLDPSKDESNFVVPRAGVEPTTLSLGRICSIQLSYRGICPLLYHKRGAPECSPSLSNTPLLIG